MEHKKDAQELRSFLIPSSTVEFAVGFFYSVEQAGKCGAGMYLKHSPTMELKGWMRVGSGSNAQAELLGMWGILLLAIHFGLEEIYLSVTLKF